MPVLRVNGSGKEKTHIVHLAKCNGLVLITDTLLGYVGINSPSWKVKHVLYFLVQRLAPNVHPFFHYDCGQSQIFTLFCLQRTRLILTVMLCLCRGQAGKEASCHHIQGYMSTAWYREAILDKGMVFDWVISCSHINFNINKFPLAELLLTSMVISELAAHFAVRCVSCCLLLFFSGTLLSYTI